MVSRVRGLRMPMVQFVEQFQPARCIVARRAHPEPHFGVVFSQRPHGEFFHQLVQAHATPRSAAMAANRSRCASGSRIVSVANQSSSFSQAPGVTTVDTVNGSGKNEESRLGTDSSSNNFICIGYQHALRAFQ